MTERKLIWDKTELLIPSRQEMLFILAFVFYKHFTSPQKVETIFADFPWIGYSLCYYFSMWRWTSSGQCYIHIVFAWCILGQPEEDAI